MHCSGYRWRNRFIDAGIYRINYNKLLNVKNAYFGVHQTLTEPRNLLKEQSFAIAARRSDRLEGVYK